jgi:hypothetical protein
MPRPLNLRIEDAGGGPIAWLDANADDTWRVSCGLVAQGRGVVVREIRVAPRPGVVLPPGGFPVGTLRLPRISQVLNFYVSAIPSYWAPTGSRLNRGLQGLERVFPFMVGGDPPKRGFARADHVTKRRGRRPLADEELLRVAVAYLDALKRGSREPVQDAAKRLGGDMTSARVSDYLNRAREEPHEILTKPRRGQAGGALTPKGRALLDQQAKLPQAWRRFERFARARAKVVLPRHMIVKPPRRKR